MNYNEVNIHDIDPYYALANSLLKKKGKTHIVYSRVMPDSISIKDNIITYSLSSKDPWDNGEDLYKSKIIKFKYGINVLVGPNGSGKSTILKLLKETLDSNYYKYFSYNNMIDGGSNSISKAGLYGNTQFMAEMILGSEGEGIMTNLKSVASAIGRFVNNQKNEYPKDPIFILFDAVDSGLSINNIRELKSLFDLIYQDCNTVVIITSANTYEMTRDSYCWDVTRSKEIKFKSYEDYCDFICKG